MALFHHKNLQLFFTEFMPKLKCRIAALPDRHSDDLVVFFQNITLEAMLLFLLGNCPTESVQKNLKIIQTQGRSIFGINFLAGILGHYISPFLVPEFWRAKQSIEEELKKLTPPSEGVLHTTLLDIDLAGVTNFEDQFLTLVLAGFETTATTLAWYVRYC